MKTFVQIVDTLNGNYQHALIDEPIKEGYEAANAVAHLVGHVKVDWNKSVVLENLKNSPNVMTGVISDTNKIVTIIYYSDEIPFKE